MQTADDIKAMYRRALRQTVIVRRYTGEDEPRPKIDATCRANAKQYSGAELTGNILQGDHKVIVYADDIVAGGIALPLLASDNLVVDGNQLTITTPPGTRKALDGTLIAYEIQARG